MRHHLAAFTAIFVCAACVDSSSGGTAAVPATAIKVTITGTGTSWVIAPDPSPGFSQLKVDVFAANDVANPAADIASGGAASLGHINIESAATSCEVTGCQWHLPSVPLVGASMGLMAAVADARATGPVWQTTYSMIVNPNQIQDNIVLGSPISASAPGYVLPTVSVTRLAAALKISATDLLSRGVCLGLVWAGRGEGTGFASGVGGATITLGVTSGAAPDLYYVNDAISDLSNTSTTNQDGLFVLVGAAATAGVTPTTSYAVPIVVAQATSAGTFVNNVAIVRPGALTVVPIIPRR